MAFFIVGIVMKSGDKRLDNLVHKGRIKGSKNRASQSIKITAGELMWEDLEYVKNLKLRLREGKAPHMEVLLTHYYSGKPAERIKIEDNRKPLSTNIGKVPQAPFETPIEQTAPAGKRYLQ